MIENLKLVFWWVVAGLAALYVLTHLTNHFKGKSDSVPDNWVSNGVQSSPSYGNRGYGNRTYDNRTYDNRMSAPRPDAFTDSRYGAQSNRRSQSVRTTSRIPAYSATTQSAANQFAQQDWSTSRQTTYEAVAHRPASKRPTTLERTTVLPELNQGVDQSKLHRQPELLGPAEQTATPYPFEAESVSYTHLTLPTIYAV